MSRDTRMLLRLAVGGYLVYLAYDIGKVQLQGSSGLDPIVAWGATVVFALAGTAFCVYAWVQYRKEKNNSTAASLDDLEA